MTTLYLVTNADMTQCVLLDDADGAEMALTGVQRSGDALAHEFAGMTDDVTTHLYTVDADALKSILQPVATWTGEQKAAAAEERKEWAEREAGEIDYRGEWLEDDDLQSLMDRDRE